MLAVADQVLAASLNEYSDIPVACGSSLLVVLALSSLACSQGVSIRKYPVPPFLLHENLGSAMGHLRPDAAFGQGA